MKITLERRVQMLEDKMAGIEELRVELRGGFESAAKRFDAWEKRFDGLERRFDGLEKHVEGLSAEIKAGDEQTRNQMRVLHEDVLNRIATLAKG